jgi:hypothetical protein
MGSRRGNVRYIAATLAAATILQTGLASTDNEWREMAAIQESQPAAMTAWKGRHPLRWLRHGCLDDLAVILPIHGTSTGEIGPT